MSGHVAELSYTSDKGDRRSSDLTSNEKTKSVTAEELPVPLRLREQALGDVLHVRVVGAVVRDDVLQDAPEVLVLLEGVGRGRELGGRADGEGLGGRLGVEEAEDVRAGFVGVVVDVLEIEKKDHVVSCLLVVTGP